jgi:hypothetical protein
MDEGNVTKRVKKHPILLHAGFLPSEIHNASGSGGGVLIGYMPVVSILFVVIVRYQLIAGHITMQIDDPGDPADRNSPRTLEYANFKRNVYQKVVDVIFKSLKGASHYGMVIGCGDKVQWVLYPGIPIEALDGKEACSACACQVALTNYPCLRCLVHHNELHMIDQQLPARTTEAIKQVYNNSLATSTKMAADDILREYGLHAIKVWDSFSLWLLVSSN